MGFHNAMARYSGRCSPVPCALVGLVLCSLVVFGCGSRDYELGPVSGRVTLDGVPVAEVYVTFQPKAAGKKSATAGPSSYGATDAEGRFTLETMKTKQPGAVVGTHTVRLAKQGKQQMPSDQELTASYDTSFPKETRDGSLTFEVRPGGTDQANFDLKSK